MLGENASRASLKPHLPESSTESDIPLETVPAPPRLTPPPARGPPLRAVFDALLGIGDPVKGVEF